MLPSVLQTARLVPRLWARAVLSPLRRALLHCKHQTIPNHRPTFPQPLLGFGIYFTTPRPAVFLWDIALVGAGPSPPTRPFACFHARSAHCYPLLWLLLPGRGLQPRLQPLPQSHSLTCSLCHRPFCYPPLLQSLLLLRLLLHGCHTCLERQDVCPQHHTRPARRRRRQA